MTERRQNNQELLKLIRDEAKAGAKEGVREEVNGGIRALALKFDQHIENHRIFQEEDLKWKKATDLSLAKLQPFSDGLTTVGNIKRLAVYWSGFLTPFGVIIAAFYAIIKFIR